MRDLGGLLSHDGSRFRPGFAVWNYLQWHTFDGPTGLVGPNAWEVARIAILVAGLSLVAWLLLGSGRAPQAGGDAVLAALPPLLVLPPFAGDIARLGPQEPLLIGGMALGGSLLLLGVNDVVRTDRRARWPLTATCLLAGYTLWLLGVYGKEVSVTVVALVPFLVVGRGAEVRRRVGSLTRRRRALVGAIATAVVLPLVHVAIEVAAIVRAKDLVYDTRLHPGAGAVRLTADALEELSNVGESHVALWILVAAAIGVTATIVMGRPHWPALGLVLTSIVALAWSAQTDVRVSRYYMPTVALSAVALSLLLARLPRRVRWLAISLAVLSAAHGAGTAHDNVAHWAETEQAGAELVRAVARLQATGCPVILGGLDEERAAAVPVLVRLRNPEPGACSGQAGFLVIGSSAAGDLLPICPADGRVSVGQWDLSDRGVEAFRCVRFASGSENFVRRFRLR